MFPSFRGGGRGRGRPRGAHQLGHNHWRNSEPNLEPSGTLIATIRLSELQKEVSGADTASHSDNPRISNAEYITSYNWIGNEAGSIIVPGAPPRWTPASAPLKLHQDPPTGIYYRDLNAARWPSFPTEPAISAIRAYSAKSSLSNPSDTAKPSFDPLSINVFGCGSTLGNILRFSRSLNKDFHFNAELIGRTLFLVRHEAGGPKALIPDVRGYGHTFPEACTTWDKEVRGSESHQRLVRYDFAGLKLLVRSETDGYLKNKVEPGAASGIGAPAVNHTAAGVVESGSGAGSTTISTALASIAIGRASLSSSSSTNLKLTTSSSTPIPQSAIFDLKTRSSRTPFTMDEILPRLWLNRTPNFILAQHFQGTFTREDVLVSDVRQQVDEWEEVHAEELRAFSDVLKKLVKAVEGLPEGKKRVGVWRVGNGDLQIRALGKEMKDWAALPRVLKAWWAGDEAESEGDREGKGEGSNVLDDEDGSEEDDDFLKF